MNYYKFAVGMALPLGWVKDLLCRGETVKMFLEKDLELSKEEYFRLLRAAGLT